ncbi:MAG: dihydropyrimidinase [Chloroflexota bacterium]|jgi:dihydropyrimidinase
MGKCIDTIVEGGKVVAGGVVADATIAISGETIAGIFSPGTMPLNVANAHRIDASGKIVMPGVVDPHVHFANFNNQADSFTSMSTAAAFGGVTTVIPYMQGTVGMPVKEFLTHLRDEGESQSLVDFAMHCRLQAPERGVVTQFDDAFDLGVTSFKMFMAYRKRGIMWDDYSLYEALEYIGRRGGMFCCHAENGDIIDYLEDKFQAEGRYTPGNYLAVRPPEAEAEAAFRALTIAKLARCPLYLVHMSTGRGISLGHQAQLSGQPVWVETCPHYLTLTNEEMQRQGGRTKIAPPLRERCDQEAVWQAVMDGSVQLIGSDHAPWPLDNKDLPPERFSEVLFGAPTIETMLPVLYSKGVAGGLIDLPRLVELLCEKPARVFGLAPRKGTITVGADADLVIFDPDIEWKVEAKELHSQAGYTPYEGWSVRGKVISTIVRGQVVMKDGELLKSPGYGSYLPRDVQRQN